MLLTIAMLALAGLSIWLGFYNVAADVPHWPLSERLLDTFRDRSMIVHSRDVIVPKDLDRPERIRAGAGLYDEM
jgi:hypothetical protein